MTKQIDDIMEDIKKLFITEDVERDINNILEKHLKPSSKEEDD
jgi:hypothetical protein